MSVTSVRASQTNKTKQNNKLIRPIRALLLAEALPVAIKEYIAQAMKKHTGRERERERTKMSKCLSVVFFL